MTFRFVISEDVTLLFQVAGAAPEPEPAVTAYPNPVPCIFYSMHGAASSNFEEEDDT